MTKYRERGATVEAHQHPNGIAGQWQVKYLDGPKAGVVEDHSWQTLMEKFEPVPYSGPSVGDLAR